MTVGVPLEMLKPVPTVKGGVRVTYLPACSRMAVQRNRDRQEADRCGNSVNQLTRFPAM
jgi:hypothetical protein